MQTLSAISTSIYQVSSFVGALVGFAVFVFAIRSLGFNQIAKGGGTNTVLIGGGFGLSLLLAFLAVGPLFVFETEYPAPSFPTPTFGITFWVIYLLEILLGVAALVSIKKRQLSPVYLAFVVIAVIGASWTAKVIELMIFVFNYSGFTVLVKIIYEIVGVVYCLVYFFAPLFLCAYLNESYKKYLEKRTK